MKAHKQQQQTDTRTARFIQRLNARLSLHIIEVLLIAMLGLAFLFTLGVANSIRPYSSDDVTTQTIVQNWQAGQVKDAVVGADTYVIKIPAFLLLDAIFPHNSRTELFASVLVFNAVLFAGIVIFIHYGLGERFRRRRSSLVLLYAPIIWLLSLNVLPILSHSEVSRVTAYMCPDYRNAELGLGLMLATLFLIFLRKSSLSLSIRHYVGIGMLFLLASFYLYSDPYFLYTLLVPVLAVLFIFWGNHQISAKRFIIPSVFLAACSVGAALLFKPLFANMGMHQVDNVPAQFIQLHQLGQAILNTISGLFKSFAADIWGSIVGLRLLPALLNTGLLLLALCALCATAVRGGLRRDAGRLLLVLCVIVNGIIYTVTTTNGPFNDRYLILSVFALVLLLGTWLPSIRSARWRSIVILGLSLGIMMNLAINAHTILVQSRPETSKPNAVTYAAIDALKANNVTTGYASYWDGNITTYLSDLKIHALPVTCESDGLHRFYWVINKPEFNRQANRTFYIYSTNQDYPSVSACTADELHEAYGVLPSKTIPLDAQQTLYIYDQDLGKFVK